MSRLKKIILIIVGVLLLVVIFAAAVLPVIIQNRAVRALGEATGRKVLLEKVSLNPLTLSLSIRGFAVEEKGGGPFFSVGALKIRVSPTSIYRRAVVLSEVVIDSPSLRIVRAEANRFNFTDIIERRKPKEEKPEKAGIFPFILKNVRLAKGSFELDDQVVAGGCKHRIDDLEINLPWLSTLPADMDKEAALGMTMTVNDAPLTIDAKGKPFKKDRESSVKIVLKRMNLPKLAVYAPQPLPVKPVSGDFTVDADIHFRLTAGGGPDFSIKGLARIDELALNRKNEQPLLRLPVLEIHAANVEPLAGIFVLDAINLEEPELFVHRNANGEWMFKELLSFGKGKAAEREAPSGVSNPDKTSTVPPQFSIASFAVKNGRVHFQDDVPQNGFKANVEAIEIAVKNIASRADQIGQYDLSLRVEKDTRLSSAGSFTVSEPTAKSSVKLTGLFLEMGWPYLAAYLTAPLKGVLNLSGDLAFSKKAGISVNNGHLDLEKFSTRYGDGEGIELASLSIDGAAFEQQENRLQIDRINLSGGDISLSRESNGGISFQSLIIPKKDGLREGEAAAPPAQGSAGKNPEAAKPLAYSLKNLDVDKIRIAFTDKGRPGDPRFTLQDAKLSVADLSGPEQKFAKVAFASTFGKRAALQVAGDFIPVPFRYRGNVKIGRLPIRAFEAYYPETFNFRVLGGLLDVNMALDMVLKDGTPAGSFKGDAGIGVFHLVDLVEEEDLLKWRRLQLDGIEGGLGPLRLAISEVSLNEVYSRIIVREDGTINLQELIRKEKDGSAEAKPVDEKRPPATAKTEEKAPEAQPPSEKEKPPDIRVSAVTIAEGTVKFTDKHLPNDFETTFYNLGGRISGLSSEASALADVDLRGNLENHSPLLIAGKINPLRGDLFIDLKLSFSDIELSSMSPYSETYLGYILKQGKLFLDLKYHIEDKKLVSENKIHIDQFTFGDKVESDKATSLPVKLGLALLKDRNGEINLDIPVTGRIDDPQFSIWRIVFHVLKNLLVKAVTAPFSLLSSLFAGEGDISVVFFSPGSSILSPAEQKKLEALAKGLIDRPSLKVSVIAYVDREKDVEGYRNELFERKLKREKFLALTKKRRIAAGESAETMTLTPEEHSAYIKALYAKEKFPKPRDAQGAEIKLPEEEMVKLIFANIKIDKDELEDLAGERADAVKNFLIGQGNIPSERIFEKKDDLFKVPQKGNVPGSRVELNAIAP